MSDRRQPYGYRPIGQAPRVLNDSLPEKERERAHRLRQNQRSMKSYKVKDFLKRILVAIEYVFVNM